MFNRKKIVAGNWKMNLDFNTGIDLVKSIARHPVNDGVIVILATPFIHLQAASKATESNDSVFIAAQDCSKHLSGAYTGEISVEMLKSIDVNYVLIGHSERRAFHNESDKMLKDKVDTVLKAGLIPIFCCGEPLEIREAGTQNEFVSKQLSNSLFHLSVGDFSKVIIAYEPIWAIGTGLTASPEQAQEMHQTLRKFLETNFGKTANECSILYGGSVNPKNANDIFSQPDVDGGLVGGASLKKDGFKLIIDAR